MPKIDKNIIHLHSGKAVYWLFGVFILNLIIKSIFLGSPEIGHDEPFTLFRVQKTFGELISDLAANNHPPFFESIIWVWLRIVGYKAIYLRIIPLVFSSLAAACIFWLGKKHFSLFTGIVASLLFTFSDFHFYLSHEIRSYPLFALLTVLSYYQYLNLLENERSKKSWLYLIIANIVLLYTHYFSATIIVAQVFHALVISKSKPVKKKMLLGFAVTVVLYLPQVVMVLSRWVEKVEGGHWLGSPNFGQLFNVLRKFFNEPPLSIVAIVFVVAALILAKKNKQFIKISSIGLLFPGVFVGMWLLAQKLPVFQDRYISFTLIGAFVLIGYALDKIPRKIGVALAIILIISMAITLNYKPDNKQWVPEMVDLIKKEKTTCTKVFIYPRWSLQCFSFHYKLEYFKDYANTTKLLDGDNIQLGYEQNVHDFILNNLNTEKLIIINFEGPISEMAKNYPNLNLRIIEKDRHGLMIIEN